MPAPIKAVAAKKAPAAKKTAPPKAAAAKKTAPARSSGPDEALMQQVVNLRDTDPRTSWSDISATLEIGQGKAMLLYMYAKVAPKDRIKMTGEDEVDAPKIVAARESGLSWGQIMARTMYGEGRLRALFESASGTTSLGNRIGKGGRHPSGAEPVQTAKKVAAGKKAAPAKAAGPAKKAAAAVPAKKIVADMSLHELQDLMTDRTVTVRNPVGQRDERIRVKKVSLVKDGNIRLTDNQGKVRSILAVHVKAVSAK